MTSLAGESDPLSFYEASLAAFLAGLLVRSGRPALFLDQAVIDARLRAFMQEERNPQTYFSYDMGRVGPLVAIGVLLVVAVIAISVVISRFPRLPERPAVILHIRLCQQAMRGHQNLHGLRPGDPFTREDLEGYMRFPNSIEVSGGVVEFTPGAVIPPFGELWLGINAPQTEGHIGRYGFESPSEFQDW